LRSLEVFARVGNVGESGQFAIEEGHLANIQQKVYKWKCARMWILLLKPQITRK